jgi:phosphatidylserine/phosphatidylglycerophosphate/cardiolipin synthase-like enzyme
MELECHFTNIRDKILTELEGAEVEITAAIAWLTDRKLFEALRTAARQGRSVRLALLDDQINRSSGLNLERLKAANGLLFWIPAADRAQGSLHHKFCVIDDKTLITGSYNWTRRASLADENIMIVRESPELAAGYLEAFDSLLAKYGHASSAPTIDTLQLQKRLKVIVGLIQLSDADAIASQVRHLEPARVVFE